MQLRRCSLRTLIMPGREDAANYAATRSKDQQSEGLELHLPPLQFKEDRH
jgi:hypothetical protein